MSANLKKRNNERELEERRHEREAKERDKERSYNLELAQLQMEERIDIAKTQRGKDQSGNRK